MTADRAVLYIGESVFGIRYMIFVRQRERFADRDLSQTEANRKMQKQSIDLSAEDHP